MSNSIKVLPYKSKKQSEYAYVVYYTEMGNEERKRCKFRLRSEADNFARTLRRAIAHNFSTGKVPLNERERVELKELSDMLAPLGVSVSQASREVYDIATSLGSLYKEDIPTAVSRYMGANIYEYKKIRLYDVIDEYLKRSKGRSIVYQTQIKCRLVPFKAFFQEDKLVSEITKEDIIEWFNNFKDKPRAKPPSPITLYNALHCIQIFLNYCKRRGYISRNPSLDVEMPKIQHKDPKYLSPEDSEKLLKASVPNSHMRLFLILALFGGFRVTELLRMKWKHISFKYNDVAIDGSMAKTHIRRLVVLPESARISLA